MLGIKPYICSMKLPRFSPTYIVIIDLLRRIRSEKVFNYKIEQNGTIFNRLQTEHQSDRLQQDFYVAAKELYTMCTRAEWYMVGRIASELKSCNALWECSADIKKSSTNWKAIRGLIKSKVLFATETTDIYFVNPIYIRRGDPFVVLNTTADLLMDVSKVTTDHVINKAPVKSLDLTNDTLLITNTNNNG